MLGDAVARKSGLMICRGVADVALPAVMWMTLRECGHQPIARDLRDDRRTGNGVTLPIAANDGSVLEREGANALAVEPHVMWRDRQARDGATDGERGRVVDV